VSDGKAHLLTVVVTLPRFMYPATPGFDIPACNSMLALAAVVDEAVNVENDNFRTPVLLLPTEK
jgi:hypothetical protein